jgi:hypothetical protein
MAAAVKRWADFQKIWSEPTAALTPLAAACKRQRAGKGNGLLGSRIAQIIERPTVTGMHLRRCSFNVLVPAGCQHLAANTSTCS